jgi:hypothetical protein
VGSKLNKKATVILNHIEAEGLDRKIKALEK